MAPLNANWHQFGKTMKAPAVILTMLWLNAFMGTAQLAVEQNSVLVAELGSVIWTRSPTTISFTRGRVMLAAPTFARQGIPGSGSKEGWLLDRATTQPSLLKNYTRNYLAILPSWDPVHP